MERDGLGSGSHDSSKCCTHMTDVSREGRVFLLRMSGWRKCQSARVLRGSLPELLKKCNKDLGDIRRLWMVLLAEGSSHCTTDMIVAWKVQKRRSGLVEPCIHKFIIVILVTSSTRTHYPTPPSQL